MIFKKLFKPFTQQKWQNDNPQIRITALQELSVDEPKHKTILHELAFNDASDKVRRLALERLNDFSLWWQASKSEKNDKLKKLAEQNIRAGLLGSASFVVDDSLKDQFIEQCNKTALLEELALKDKSDTNRLKLLNKLNKSQLFMQALQDSATSVWLKTELINRLSDLPLLEKLNKKPDESIKTLVSDKIKGIKAAIEKPLSLKKDIGLVLAKLNALKDKVDIENIEAKQALLTLQWETLQQSLSLLADDEAAELKAKFVKINASLNTIIEPLRVKFKAQQEQLADLKDKLTNKETIAARLKAVEAQLSTAIENHDEATDDNYSQSLLDIQQQLQQLNLAAQDKSGFIGQIEQFQHKISQIPLITQCMAQAKQLLEELQALSLPTDMDEFKAIYPAYKDWLQQWRDNRTKLGLAFPDDIQTIYSQLSSQWKDVTGALLKEQEQMFSQAKKAVTDLKYLLSGGKYHRAFGLFKKTNYLYEALNESQQSRLSRDFDNVKTQVEDLADWQDYIATPRKQQILAEMVELAESPLQSPQEQAKKVRFTRQMWNSLGKTSERKSGKGAEVGDADLELQFNAACENAFEICRVFYAEKETIRSQNLALKQAICERLEATAALLPAQLLGAQQAQESKPEDGKSKDSEAVDASEADPQADSETPDKDKDKNAQVTDIPWQKVESALSQARKDWQSSGEVDREDVGVINQRYFDTLNPVQKAVRDNQNENASFKEGLVNKAKALLESEDVFAAINQLKDIQQRWKTIGFSGSKADGALWRKFRQANDLVFAKRDELKNQRSEQNQQQLTDFNHQLDEVEAQVLAADSLSVLNQQSASLQAVMTQLDDQDKHIQSKISPKAQALQSLINTTKKALQEVAAKQVYINAFDQFEHVSKQDAPDDQIQLSALWNDTLSGLGDDTDTSLRYDLTIGLEIAFGVGSPVRDTDRRMALQMEMLSKKINHGQQKNSHNAAHDELLKGWFKVGKLKDDETELLERIKALFIE